jgi:hypothetical protein
MMDESMPSEVGVPTSVLKLFFFKPFKREKAMIVFVLASAN